MARSVPIPIPLNGLNTVSPDLPLEAGYARELTNYSIVNGRLRMRDGIERVVSATTGVGLGRGRVLWMDLQALTTNSYYIVSPPGGSYLVYRESTFTNIATIPAGTLNTWATPTLLVTHLSLSLITGISRPRNAVYPFADWSFSTIGIVDTNIITSCSHKGRLYVCDGTTLEYSNDGAISGSMYDSFQISDFMDGQSVVRIFSNTIGSGNNNAENILVAFGNRGKVLVYQGDYPASSTWNLLANYDMPAPITASSFCVIDGDIWVSAANFAYWFSELFTTGVQGARGNSPSLAIENLWDYQVSSVSNPMDFETYYLVELDAIVCSLNPTQNNLPLPFLSLVYFRKYKAWTYWKLPTFSGPVRKVTRNSQVYYYGSPPPSGGGGGFTPAEYTLLRIPIESNRIKDTYSSTGTTLATLNITTSWKTPFVNAFNGKNQKVEGVRPFFSSALNGFLEKIRLIFDYTDYNSPFGFYDSAINPGNYADSQVDVPAVAWDQYSPYSGVSGMGGGVSLQITQAPKTGSADEQLNEIYSATLYVSDGGDMI